MVVTLHLEDIGHVDRYFVMQEFLSRILPLVKYRFKGEFVYSFCVSSISLVKITGRVERVDGETSQITLLIKLKMLVRQLAAAMPVRSRS